MEELITFETALLAKEKGFNWNCHKSYNKYDKEIWTNGFLNNNLEIECYNRISAPSQSVLQKWLREDHTIDISIIVEYNTIKKTKSYRVGIIYIENNIINAKFMKNENNFIEYNNYEEALEQGLIGSLKSL